MVTIPVMDWSKAPVQPGSPARAPHDGWENWFDYTPENVPEIVRIGEEDYLDEWRDQAEFGLDDIAKAARRSNIDDVNADLNKAVGRIAALYAQECIDHDGEIKVLDIGASTGNTTLSFLRYLPQELHRRIRLTAIDLSEKSLRGYETGEEFENGYEQNVEGITIDHIEIGSDIDVLPSLDEGGYDIVFETAVRHQHGENVQPTKDRYRVTREGGILLAGDWHVWDMWKHPARVYQLLLPILDFESEDDRRELMEEFVQTYPKATDSLPDLKPQQMRSNREIAAFWKNYGNIWKEHKDPSRPKFRFIEGHRPAGDYLRDMKIAGYKSLIASNGGAGKYTRLAELMHSNPHYLRPESTLNAITTGIKL